eukprot:1151932-Pelagomonas_calceolata.AAC.5
MFLPWGIRMVVGGQLSPATLGPLPPKTLSPQNGPLNPRICTANTYQKQLAACSPVRLIDLSDVNKQAKSMLLAQTEKRATILGKALNWPEAP